MVPALSRRAARAAGVVVLAAAAVTLSSCSSGGSDSPAAATPASSGAASSAAPSPTAAAFPVTVTTSYGELTLDEQPTRVVVLAENFLDPLLDLGVTPVGIRLNTAEVPPWDDELTAADAAALSLGTTADELSVESIVARTPDLVIGPSWAIDEKTHTALTAAGIATAAFEAGDTSWQDETRAVATLVGRGAEGEELIADVEAQVEATAAADPVPAGSTYVLGALFEPTNVVYVADAANSPGRFFASLGLELVTIPKAAMDGTRATVSRENIAMFDKADLLVFGAFDAELEKSLLADRLYQNLAAVREGRVVTFADVELASAFNNPTVANVPTLLETLEPGLAALS